ncbi:helix-turn-helix domain-containing protein [Dinghuibacter silviterrae]|uniref:AraC-like DNA-binding protein n=1 Tax=Dinghuibacter silviterrae TaxID=1539049 RepID=A0A4R8DGS4_9BACT|nr:AraC family transcriptional regulator [Dinghuibacter silviterrae]TDW96160.1 AraC-like DNA-binding protein [Dinghuibacter silviterrae]
MSVFSIQDIFFSCTDVAEYSGEHFASEHGLARIISGEMQVSEADRSYILSPGQTVLFSRNRLARFVKNPLGDGTFRMITVFFRQTFLAQYYAAHTVRRDAVRMKDVLCFPPTPLLDSFFTSLLPYEELNGALPEELVGLKLTEAVTILRPLDPAVDGLLSDFSEPGKIDLADFMEKNFAFNISLEKFAYLTGRSLATFKRDFRKTFQTPPQKWLLERRLRQAHFLITERKLKPSEACMEVGFENLSHFSTTFKQQFGYNPSSLTR